MLHLFYSDRLDLEVKDSLHKYGKLWTSDIIEGGWQERLNEVLGEFADKDRTGSSKGKGVDRGGTSNRDMDVDKGTNGTNGRGEDMQLDTPLPVDILKQFKFSEEEDRQVDPTLICYGFVTVRLVLT